MERKKSLLGTSNSLRFGLGTGRSRDGRQLLLFATLLTFLVSMVPYSDILLYPLRLFVTFVHESSHALAALLVGSGVTSVSVAPNASGLTHTTGDNILTAWVIDSAGYLGTALFGALLIQMGRIRATKARLTGMTGALSGKMNAGRMMLFACAIFMVGIMIWVRDPFTLVAGLTIAALFGLAARFASPRVAEFIAMFIAIQTSLNALYDIKTLILLSTVSPQTPTDAMNMQHAYVLPAPFWAILWALIALGMMGLSLWSYLRATVKR